MPYKYTYQDLLNAGAPELETGQWYQVHVVGSFEREFVDQPRVYVRLLKRTTYRAILKRKPMDVELACSKTRLLERLNPDAAIGIVVDLCTEVVSEYHKAKTDAQRLAEIRASVAGEYGRPVRRTDVGFG